jgi:DNA repair exonuclease SbcCD ATPase subunit
MILRRLRLKNFRRYREAQFSFPEGLVGVLGPNGSGKSTIFEAVGWTLFGNPLSRTGGFGLVSTQAGAGAPCWAELDFEAGGRAYKVHRRLAYGGEFTWSQVFEEGTPTATGNQATRSLISGIVGLHSAAFLKMVHARQGELGGLARDTFGYRRRFFEELLELDWLDRVRARISSDADALKRVLLPGTASCSEDEETHFETLLEQSILAVDRFRAESDVRSMDLQEWERRRERSTGLMTEIDVVKKALGNVDRALSECKRSIEKLGAAAADPRTESSILAGLAEAKGRENSAATSLTRVSRCLDALSGSTSSLCPVCGGPMSSSAKGRLLTEREKLFRELEAARSEKGILVRRLEEFSRLKRRSEQGAALARDALRLQDDRSKVQKRVASLRADLEALGYDPAAHEEVRKRVRVVQEDLQRAAARKVEVEAHLALAKKAQAELMKTANNRERFEALDCVATLFEGFRSEIIDGFIPAFERACSGLLAEATEGKYSRIVLDREFIPRLQDGSRTYVMSRFSGGEQDVASLAIRLGLLRLASSGSPIECAVLDEVFGSQDRRRRRSLLRALGRMCPPFRQIFVLTHAEDVQELLPHVIQITDEAARHGLSSSMSVESLHNE